MAKQKLADQVVEVSVSGLEKAKTMVQAGLGKIASAAKYTVAEVSKIASAAANVAKIGGAMGGGFLATFGRGAMAGTVESDRLGKAWEYLTRVVGAQLAPYVRMLTNMIVDAANAYRGLTPETKKTITQIALFAAGIGAAIVLLPTIVGFLGAMGTVLAAIASPVGLVIAGIAAMMAAAADYFDFFNDEAPNTANNVDDANRTWTDRFIGYIEKVVIAGAEMFNYIARKGAEVSDFLGRTMALAGELVGLYDKGTVDMYDSMDAIEPPQINIDGIKESFAEIKSWARKTASSVSDYFKTALDKAGEEPFTVKVNTQFESLQGTFDRLQTAFASGNAENVAEKNLKVLERIEIKIGELNRLQEQQKKQEDRRESTRKPESFGGHAASYEGAGGSF